jgi:uncharacterized lipoprotein YmbA
MNRVLQARGMAGAVLLALLAACGSTPKESFYTLAGPATPMPAEAASPVAIFVGPVTVPEAVDRTPLVVRTGPNSVDIDDFHRWAEPLKSAIPRVIAETLMRELATPRVMASRAGAAMPVDFKVAVEIQRFESSFADGATLDALWTVTATRGGAPRTGRTTVQERTSFPDREGVAAAHSRALARLGRDIAAAIKN